MNPEDTEAWEAAKVKWLRRFQEEAYAELDSLRWWIRQHYHLLPTDERYLNLTDDEVRVEYWLYVLTARRVHAEKEGIAVETLDDLLSGATVEEKMAKIDAALERAAREKALPPQGRDTVLHWKAED